MFRYALLPTFSPFAPAWRKKAAAEAVSILPRPFSPSAPRRSEGNAERAKSAPAEEKRACAINYLASDLAPRKASPSAQSGCEPWAKARAAEPPRFCRKTGKKRAFRSFCALFRRLFARDGRKIAKNAKKRILTYALKSVSLLRKGQKGIKTAQRAI